MMPISEMGDGEKKQKELMTMTNGASAGAATAAAAAAIANAIKASGAIVQVEARDFAVIVGKTKDPLVVITEGGVFSTRYQYLTAYKGLIFHTKTKTPLELPSAVEVIKAGKIWIPG
jgi:ABC-type transport system substrate-binding protein